MLRRISVLVIGVIIVITVTSVVYAQGDYKNITRVQEDQWCTNHGYAGVTARDEHPQTVYSFPKCKRSDGTLYDVDMTQLCRDLYGDAYADPRYWDYNNYDSWYCNHVNAPAPTPIPPQSNGGSSSGGNSQPQPSSALYPDAQEPNGPGVKVPIICQKWGHTWSSSEPGNAYGWTCDDGFTFDANAFTKACSDAWGSSRPYATLANWRDKYGWRCSSQPGYVDPYGGSGNSGGQNTDCPSVPTRLSVGQSAWVSDYDPYDLKVFTEPSMSSQQLPGVPIRQTVTIMRGPECHDGRVWVFISYQGRTGWAIEVNKNNTYNLIPGTYGGSGGNIVAQAVSLNNVSTFVFRLDVQSCEIVNGSDFVTSEIKRLYREGISGRINIIGYLVENWGVSEQIRHRVEQTFAQAAPSCANLRYRLGAASTMDTSGPGNTVFGYYAAFYGVSLDDEDHFSDIAQGLNKNSLGQWSDNPDDRIQRRAGRALHSMAPNPGDVTSEMLESIADQMKVF